MRKKFSLLILALAAAGLTAGPATASDAVSEAPAKLELMRPQAGTSGLRFTDAQSVLRQNSSALRAQSSEVEYRKQAAIADKSLSHPQVVLNTMMIWGTKELDYGNLNVGARVTEAASKSPVLSHILQGLGPAGQELSKISIPLRYKTDLDGPRASLGATWLLYTGGRISAKQAASDAAARGAENDFAHQVNKLDTELAQKYFMLQLAHSVAELRKDALADEEREVKRAKAFENAGTISRLERMSVEVNRDKAKRELLASQTDERVAEAELLRLLHLENLPELTTPLFVVRGDIGSLSHWQNKALSESPLLASYGAKRTQAEQLVKAAKGAYLPTLYAFGEKNLIKHYLTLPEPNWIAGIGLKFTLWNNHDRYADLSAARAKLSEAQAGIAEVENQLKTGIEVAWLRTTQLRDQYVLTKSTVALATENLRMREAAFANGLTTANEVWDARTKLTGAQIEQKLAAYKFIVAWSQLNTAAGSMTAFDESLERKDIDIEK